MRAQPATAGRIAGRVVPGWCPQLTRGDGRVGAVTGRRRGLGLDGVRVVGMVLLRDARWMLRVRGAALGGGAHGGCGCHQPVNCKKWD